jgi:ABC-type Fe3+ transport system permease subunit
MDALARLGLAARGAIYLLVGALAVLLAFGQKKGETDQRGAMQQLAQHTGGFVVLLIIAIGLAGYALWRFSEAAFGVAGEGKKAGPRTQSAIRGIVYTFLAISAFTILAQGRDKSQAKQQESYTARLMHDSAGRWLVGLIGLVIAVVGAVLIYQGVKKKFEKDFKLGEMSPAARKVTEFLGTVGTASRGVVFAVAGVLVVIAAVQFDPKKARGIDGALLALRDTPLGPVLLVAIALGLVMFGLFGLCEARWRRT